MVGEAGPKHVQVLAAGEWGQIAAISSGKQQAGDT